MKCAYLLVPLIRFALAVVAAPFLTLFIRDLVVFVFIVIGVTSAVANQFAFGLKVLVGPLVTVITNAVGEPVVNLINILEKQLAITFFLVPLISFALAVVAASLFAVFKGDILVIFILALIRIAFTTTDIVALRFKIIIGVIDTCVAGTLVVSVVVSANGLEDKFARPKLST